MIKNSNLNLFEELRYIIQLIEKKCQELPSDITSWTLMAEKYDVNSKKYQAVFDASVNPRLDYLNALKELRKKLIKQLNLVTTKSNDYHVFLKALDIQMPIETLMRKYNELNNVMCSSTVDPISTIIQDVLSNIEYIQNNLNQLILRCSIGEFNFKELDHKVRVLKPLVAKKIEEKQLSKQAVFNQVSDILIQKVEMDISTRVATQDKVLIYSSIQMYLSQLETNDDYKLLKKELQYKIKQIVLDPIDKIKVQHNLESDVAVHELQQLLEPIQGNVKKSVPESATSIHRLIQQAIEQQKNMSKIKVNVMGAVTHLSKQLKHLFDFQMTSPVQVSSLIGTAWLQNPLTTPEEIKTFSDGLSMVKKSQAYVQLSQCFDDKAIEDSFLYLQHKLDEMSEYLRINQLINQPMEANETVGLVNANNCYKIQLKVDQIKTRRKLIGRAELMEAMKMTIQQLSKSVNAHVLLMFYEHSVSPEKIDLNHRVQEVLNSISDNFSYELVNSSMVNKNFVLTMAKQLINESCHSELEKNIDIIAKKRELNKLILQLKDGKVGIRSNIRKKVRREKQELKKQMLRINIPRLKQYMSFYSDDSDTLFPNGSDVNVSRVLKELIQEKLVLEQVSMN